MRSVEVKDEKRSELIQLGVIWQVNTELAQATKTCS